MWLLALEGYCFELDERIGNKVREEERRKEMGWEKKDEGRSQEQLKGGEEER